MKGGENMRILTDDEKEMVAAIDENPYLEGKMTGEQFIKFLDDNGWMLERI